MAIIYALALHWRYASNWLLSFWAFSGPELMTLTQSHSPRAMNYSPSRVHQTAGRPQTSFTAFPLAQSCSSPLPSPKIPDTFLLDTWSAVLYSSLLTWRAQRCNSSWPPLRPKMPKTSPVHLAEPRGFVTLLESMDRACVSLCFALAHTADKTLGLQ